jgi:hypothetical protein
MNDLSYFSKNIASFALKTEAQNMAFVPRPNDVSDEHTDLYYETTKDNKVALQKSKRQRELILMSPTLLKSKNLTIFY